MSGFLEAIKEQVIVFDGAMGTMIRNYSLSQIDFGGAEFEMLSDILSLSRPDIIKDIHLEYFKSGCNAVETNTFGACPLRLREFDFKNLDDSSFPQEIRDLDLKNRSYEEIAYFMNVKSCEIAKKAIEEIKSSKDYDGRPLFAVASIGPSNYVLSPTNADLHKGRWEDIEENFYVQAKGLIDGGADVFLFETQQDVLEIKAAVSGAFKAMKEKNVKIPVMCQVTVNEHSRMQIFNTHIHSALTTLAHTGIDVFGINCSIGPDLMEPTIKKISQYSPLPVSVLPNAGLPESENGETVYRLSPESLAKYLEKFVLDYGVNIVGGCCGTSPLHMKEVCKRVKGKKPFDNRKDNRLYISGPQDAVLLEFSDELLRIGERLNIRGSKKVREAVENEEGKIDFDVLEEVVNEQVNDLGLLVIDVCMDSNQVETKDVLPKVVQGITHDFKGGLCIDSFDADALSDAVKFYPGRPLLNSISMESHENTTKADYILERTAFHSPAYIALAADDEGPAVTAEKKYEIAGKLVETAAKYNISPSQLFIDINAFPIGSESVEGMNFALESLNSIPLIKKIAPGIKTTIGVSNLTNGLAKKPYMRKVLTSVFLDEGRKKGLDAAIVNPNHYVPVKSLDKKDYELGLKAVLERDMDAFAELEEIALQKKGTKIEKRSSYEGLSPAETVSEKIKDGFKSRKKGSLVFEGNEYFYSDSIVEDAALAIKEIKPLDFINDYLMEAMNVLGERFAKGEASLPHLLKAADIMKEVMNFLEKLMKGDKPSSEFKGTIVIGTVYQDVHSIGKDLTKTLFENYGYRVIDLGVQVPLESYIETALKYNADAIGMSALLVQTSNHMLSVVKMMREKGLDIPVFIGGAPVNLKHAASVAMSGAKNSEDIKPDVFYCRTAMDSVNLIGKLLGEKRAETIEQNKKDLLKILNEQNENLSEEKNEVLQRKILPHENNINPFPAEIIEKKIEEINIREKNLFITNWKFKPDELKNEDKLNELKKEFEELKIKAQKEELIKPLAAAGIFPCRKNNDSIDIFSPINLNEKLGTIKTTQIITQKDKFKISDYINDKSDFIGIQIVTSGNVVTESTEKLSKNGDSEGAYLLNGLANRIAEDLASDINDYLEKKAGVNKSARFSPGYPGMDISENIKLFRFLGAEKLGIKVTDSGEFIPGCTTAAIVCFHPDASH
ncbi:MAG: homocysteine S-methyltransferase family protein [Desulfobacteraceae bacterium]|nr:homocysteine S-methyltransferase family protein [Desulfobacteraceae bacterium]